MSKETWTNFREMAAGFGPPDDCPTLSARAVCVKWPPLRKAGGKGMRTDMSTRHPLPAFRLPRPHLAHLAAMLALAALVFHGLLPLTQQMVRQAQAANGIEQVVLCSALGLRVLALKDGAPVDTDPAKSETIAKLCPVCFALGTLPPAILAAPPALPLPAVAITSLYGAASGSTLAQASHLPQQARAPPAVSLA
jgi:hypothetical protein